MKKYFFTGLIILLPVVLTLMVIIFLFHFFTTPFVPIVSYLLHLTENNLLFTIPEGLDLFIARVIALLIVVIFVLFLGIIARLFLVRHFLRGINSIVSHIPFVKTIFKVSRDVFTALFSQEGKKAFKCPVMIPFPDTPNHCIGFVLGDVPDECQKKIKGPLTAIFVPTAPHPISGYLLLVPRNKIQSLDMTNEDAVKFLVSCGMIVPDNHDNH